MEGVFIIENPQQFKLEETTIWSFPNRGKWATHSGEYRGNWSPYIPRNLILRYSKENDWVLDQFLGSGTTLVESKLLNRNAIGIDINNKSLDITNSNLKFPSDSNSRICLRQGDARSLLFIKNDSIDFICTHPPYADVIKYSDGISGDLSLFKYEEFLSEMRKVAQESYRVVKKGHFCAYMIGDIRRNSYVMPLGLESMQIFVREGFILKEIIIKEQHNCRSTQFWKNKKRNFLMLAHEYIFVLEKK
ncbi:TRM11 family SAM-dependent methyltransferase [Anaerosporobacter sp.]